MPRAKFTQYYKDAMDRLLDYLDEKQCLAIRLEQIKNGMATITIGVSDGKKFVLEFGTVVVEENGTVHVESDNIHVDMHRMIHMEYNSDGKNNTSVSMIEALSSAKE